MGRRGLGWWISDRIPVSWVDLGGFVRCFIGAPMRGIYLFLNPSFFCVFKFAEIDGVTGQNVWILGVVVVPGQSWARTLTRFWVLGCRGVAGDAFLFIAEKSELYDSFYSVGNMAQLA